MEPTTSQPQKNRRTLWIIIAGVLLLLVIVGVVIAVSMGNTKKSDTTASNTTSSTASPTPVVATKDQVIKQLDSLGSSIKQLASDQTAAKNALKDNERQIKVTK